MTATGSFTLDGVFYTRPDRLTIGEMLTAEKMVGAGADQWTATMSTAIGLYLACRRVSPQKFPITGFVAWCDALALDDEDRITFEEVDTEPAPETEYVPDPTDAAGETAAPFSSRFPEPAPSSASSNADSASTSGTSPTTSAGILR